MSLGGRPGVQKGPRDDASRMATSEKLDHVDANAVDRRLHQTLRPGPFTSGSRATSRMELSRSGLDTSIVGPGLVPELGSCEPELTANDFLPVSLVANLTAVPLEYNRANARLQAGLLFLATVAMLVPSVVSVADSAAGSAFAEKLSVSLSVLLFAAYGLGLLFSLKTHREFFGPRWPASQYWSR
jgi:hypothetical protein